MELLAELSSGQMLSSGLFPGLAGDAAPLWKTGQNVLFDDGGVRKNDGLLSLTNLPERPTGLKSTVADGEPRLFIGAGTEAYRYRSADGLTNIGSFAGAGGIYQFLPWDTWVLISNGVDPVELWQNAGVSAPIIAPFNRANTIFGYQLQAFAGGTNNGGRYVEWSPVNAVTDWTVTPTGTAGRLLLRDLGGDIVAAKRLGNSIGIYSGLDGGLFTFIGGTSIYGFRKPISGVSAVSPYSIVSAGDRHYGLNRENAFVTDLVSVKYIDEPAMRRFLREEVNWSRMAEVYGWLDAANAMVRWVVPTTNQNTGVPTHREIGYRYDNGAWTIFHNLIVAGEEAGAFANQFLASRTKLFRQDKTSPDNDGALQVTNIQTKPLHLGARNNFKRIMKVCIDGEWSGTVDIGFAFADTPNSDFVDTVTRPIASEIYLDNKNEQCEFVYLVLFIRAQTPGATFRISGARIYGEVLGYVT